MEGTVELVKTQEEM